jgi:hypothetical protein
MSRAADQEIIAWAVGENATVVTLDADFHTILAVSGATAPSVIRLRMQGLSAPAVVEIVRSRAREVSSRTGTWVDGDGESEQDHRSQAADRRRRLRTSHMRVFRD